MPINIKQETDKTGVEPVRISIRSVSNWLTLPIATYPLYSIINSKFEF